MNFLTKLFTRQCYLCGSKKGGRWLDESTTSTLRQPDNFKQLMASSQLKQMLAGNRSFNLFSPSSQKRLLESREWYLCYACLPDS